MRTVDIHAHPGLIGTIGHDERINMNLVRQRGAARVPVSAENANTFSQALNSG